MIPKGEKKLIRRLNKIVTAVRRRAGLKPAHAPLEDFCESHDSKDRRILREAFDPKQLPET